MNTEIDPPWRVMQQVVKYGDNQELGRRAGYRPESVARWSREPVDRKDFTGTGRCGPLDFVNILVQLVREKDGSTERAWPLAQYVARLCDGFFVSNPEIDFNDGRDLVGYAGEIMMECGETLTDIHKALEDGKLTDEELARIVKDAEAAQAALEAVKIFARSRK